MIKEILGRCQGKGFFCDGMVSKKNRKRDLVITLVIIVVLGVLLVGNHFYFKEKRNGHNEINIASEEVMQEKATQDNPVQDSVTEVMVEEKKMDVVKPTVRIVDMAKPVVRNKIITAPMPRSYEKDSLGRLVCGKRNDHPQKSDQGKGKHMDMECCMDPDEYPNPHCYYDSDKYGKYL